MGIKIGNNNKISKSTIAETVSGNIEPPKKSWSLLFYPLLLKELTRCPARSWASVSA